MKMNPPPLSGPVPAAERAQQMEERLDHLQAQATELFGRVPFLLRLLMRLFGLLRAAAEQRLAGEDAEQRLVGEGAERRLTDEGAERLSQGTVADIVAVPTDGEPVEEAVPESDIFARRQPRVGSGRRVTRPPACNVAESVAVRAEAVRVYVPWRAELACEGWIEGQFFFKFFKSRSRAWEELRSFCYDIVII